MRTINDYAPALPSHWVWDADEKTWAIRGAHCWVWMQPRPHHCDRGNWLAHIELLPAPTPHPVPIDHADLWPRYYFDLDRAKLECEAWLQKRQQWVAPEMPVLTCADCTLRYEDFPLDVVLPDADWLAIHPEGPGGVLCAQCIVKRASKLKGVVIVRAYLE